MPQSKVTKVVPQADYKLLLTFETGEHKLFDVSPYIIGNWYGKLKDLAFFNSVRPIGETVTWNDGQDIAPHELYENSVPIIRQS